MKKLTFREFLALSIFLLVILFSGLAVYPLYSLVSKKLDSTVQTFCHSFTEKTGLSVSYQNLSPSIVTGLRIKNIILTDVSDGKRIIVIKKTILRYSVIDFLKGRGLSSIKNLTVDGFVLDLDSGNPFISRLMEKNEIPASKDDSIIDKAEKHKKLLMIFESKASELPFDVFIKNVHLIYTTNGNKADLLLKKVTIAYLVYSRMLHIKTTGGFEVYTKKNKKYSFDFNATGSITDNLENSSITLRLSDFTDGSYTLNRLNLLVGYKNRNFELRTIQNAYPVFVEGKYVLDSGEASISLKAKDLRPGNAISLRQNEKLMKKIRGLGISFDADAKYKARTGELNYSSSGKIQVPDSFYPGGFTGSYSLYGNQKQIVFNDFSAFGQNIDLNYFGSCTFSGLKLSGTMNLNKLMLRNGRVISTEIYFDPLDFGFMAFAPQLMLEEKSLTALQLSVIPVKDSIDFAFEVQDYSHLETETPGTIKLNGSYIGGTKYIQANLSSNGIFLDSAAETASFFCNKKSSFGFLSGYAFNGEMFFSTDFRQISYNIPYAFAVNTKKEGQFIYISLDGNDSSVNLSRFDFINSGKLLHLSGIFEKSPDGKDAFFMLDLNADSIPYHFTGNLMPGLLTMNGDYGFMFDMNTEGESFSGNLVAENLPVGTAGTIMTFSLDSTFSYTKEDGFNLILSRVEGQDAGGKYAFKPSFSITGNASKYGVFLDAISYSDKFSTIEGKSELLWNINDSLFDSVSLNLSMKNPVSSEGVTVAFDLSNPTGEIFSVENLKKTFYLNSQIVLNNFGLNRFTAEQSDNNSITATLIISGVPENPYAGLNIENLSLMTAGKTVGISGSAYVEEKNLTVDSMKLDYNALAVKDIFAVFDLSSFTGHASGVLDTVVAKQTVHAPLEFTVSDTVMEDGKLLPVEFAASLVCDKFSGSLFKKEVPFSLTVLHTNDITSVFTSEAQGISGTIASDGRVNFSVAENKPVQFNLNGNLTGPEIDMKLSNFSLDAGKLFEYIDITRLKVYNGTIRGHVEISGLKSDPEFKGSLSLGQAEFSLPKIITQHVFVPKAVFVMNHNEIELKEARGFVKKDIPVCASLNVLFDRWSFSRLESRIWNPDGVFMPGDFEIRLAQVVGDCSLDINLAFEDHYLDVSGDIFLKKVTASVKTRELANAPPKRSWYPRADLDLHFGQHVTFLFDPLLRAVFVPNTDFAFKYDMSQGAFELGGELAFRSGDISYLSRNFYLKNGSMKFNSNDPTFNPLISIQAETRERDDDGNDVRIILSATNQYLLNFNAQFSSIPAKSEAEIRSLLGQIAVGDSDKVSSLLLATGDYAIQSTIGRSIENKLRDFLNFDILSVRTNVLQNALNYGLLNRTEDSKKTDFGIGNFFDNSTVYIGKYFGSSLYVDALMHWSYDETKVDDELTAGGLVFRPEFGLEIEAPFGNIRWNMAPDISGFRNDRFVSATSVTLSWKFSF